MKKPYIKFYEVGNNRYYYLVADGDLYIATESFIDVGNKKLFKKKELIQGLKLLKVTPILAILFSKVADAEVTLENKEYPDMTEYNVVDSSEIKKYIKDTYNEIADETKKDLLKEKDIMIKSISESDISSSEFESAINKINKSIDDALKMVDEYDPLKLVNLDVRADNKCSIICDMCKNNIKHLYSEKINNFAKNVYMYDNDKYGTLTIYKIIVIKNTIKTIDTFIYNRDIISALMSKMEENEKGKEN